MTFASGLEGSGMVPTGAGSAAAGADFVSAAEWGVNDETAATPMNSSTSMTVTLTSQPDAFALALGAAPSATVARPAPLSVSSAGGSVGPGSVIRGPVAGL